MRKADNLPQFCAIVMKSGNLNFLEPSGPFQACNGTAVPLPLFFITLYSLFLRFVVDVGWQTPYSFAVDVFFFGGGGCRVSILHLLFRPRYLVTWYL